MEVSQAPAVRAVQCPQCHQVLMGGDLQENGSERCPRCRSELRVWRFPALQRSSEDSSRGAVALPGEAACFFHPEKRASVSCERCGRFVCTLCDLPVGNRHLCPSCVGSGLESEKVPELVSHRFVWSNLALTVGWLPLLLPFLMAFYVVTGPTAVFAGIWGWRKPGSVVQGRRRWVAAFGILGGLIQIAVMLFMVFAIWKGGERQRGRTQAHAPATATYTMQFALMLQEENRRG